MLESRFVQLRRGVEAKEPSAPKQGGVPACRTRNNDAWTRDWRKRERGAMAQQPSGLLRRSLRAAPRRSGGLLRLASLVCVFGASPLIPAECRSCSLWPWRRRVRPAPGLPKSCRVQFLRLWWAAVVIWPSSSSDFPPVTFAWLCVLGPLHFPTAAAALRDSSGQSLGSCCSTALRDLSAVTAPWVLPRLLRAGGRHWSSCAPLVFRPGCAAVSFCVPCWQEVGFELTPARRGVQRFVVHVISLTFEAAAHRGFADVEINDKWRGEGSKMLVRRPMCLVPFSTSVYQPM